MLEVVVPSFGVTMQRLLESTGCRLSCVQDLAAADLPASVGVWAVDTACIVPVTLTKKPYAKAYAYRSGTVNIRNERLRLLPYSGVPGNQDCSDLCNVPRVSHPWMQIPPPVSSSTGLDLDALAFPSLVASIPWTSVDLGIVPDLAALLRESQAFDASVPGVDHMTGSQSAGYARWEAFRRSGLSQYAARRNNPMLRYRWTSLCSILQMRPVGRSFRIRDEWSMNARRRLPPAVAHSKRPAWRRQHARRRSGVSRMSAYHHFGMVSPFRIAREAASTNNSGARKFADEFMTWREISHCFCFHSWHILESLQVVQQGRPQP